MNRKIFSAILAIIYASGGCYSKDCVDMKEESMKGCLATGIASDSKLETYFDAKKGGKVNFVDMFKQRNMDVETCLSDVAKDPKLKTGNCTAEIKQLQDASEFWTDMDCDDCSGLIPNLLVVTLSSAVAVIRVKAN
ncbi:Uncharacterised protein g9229 [Pycnogonum litorale]